MPHLSQTTIGQWQRQSALPRLEARLFLEYVLHLSHAQLITASDQCLRQSEERDLNQLQERRLKGEPMAYILGCREFYGHIFKVSDAVLIPRPETEHLVDIALDSVRGLSKPLIWDLGTGSGIVAISLKLALEKAHVCASDISQAALDVAKENARRLEADVRFMQGSWFDVCPSNETHAFDAIVSNPPYIDVADQHLGVGDLRFEPESALTDFSDGYSALKILIAGAPRYLKPGGYLWLEHGFEQGELLQSCLLAAGFSSVMTLKDYAGLDRVSGGRFGV